MVAKSYQNLQRTCEPYESKGRMYVKVLTAAGKEKQVRWYTESEYAKLYGVSAPKVKQTEKEALGFGDGYITIFKGDTYALKDWFKEQGAKYTKFWGWSFGTFAAMPEDIPAGVDPIRLDWEVVGNEDGSLKGESQVKAAVEDLIYDESNSEYVGEIGEKIELDLYIQKAIQFDGYYGTSTMHIMEDDSENIFVWTTTAKVLQDGCWYHVKGTIKDHKTYRHVKQTILTRCRVEQL